jgi:hypothetical protein
LGAARSPFRVATPDVVKALLDGGEARFDHRLEFEVGEDIGPVLFDAFVPWSMSMANSIIGAS